MRSHIRIHAFKASHIGLFAAFSLLVAYIEYLIPFSLGVPGIKLGLANIASLMVLYIYGAGAAALVTLIRVLLSGLLFGNMFGMIYSLAGAALSLLAMAILKRSGRFSVTGVSMAGGVFHNIGQLVCAVFIVRELRISFYGPALVISGLIAGFLVGYAADIIIRRTGRFFDKSDL